MGRRMSGPIYVDFVSYDGKYPNLCAGKLVITVNDEKWVFDSHALSSGGSVSFSKGWEEQVTDGEWSVSEWPEGFPTDRRVREEVVRVVNANVRPGCCGGCV